MGSVLNRRLGSARDAVEFLGGGIAVSAFGDLAEAEITWVAANDDAIGEIARRLLEEAPIRPGDIVFHSSGALPASVLGPLGAVGALVASVHPLRSFADPASASAGFSGTWCGFEGSPEALAVLDPAFRAIGGNPFVIGPGAKAVYHASAVFASNYLVALIELALRCGQLAGLDRETASRVLGPLIRGTLDNVDRLGPAGALTGPIARGDARFVAEQTRALLDRDPRIGRLYRELGQIAVELAREQGSAPAGSLDAIAALLAGDSD